MLFLAPDGLELGLVLHVEVGEEVNRGVPRHGLLRGPEAPLADEELEAEGSERLSQLIQFRGWGVVIQLSCWIHECDLVQDLTSLQCWHSQ